jgi:hypothetical protein
MKLLREILRTLLMIGGAVLLIAALYPLLNPGMFALATKQVNHIFSHTFVLLFRDQTAIL